LEMGIKVPQPCDTIVLSPDGSSMYSECSTVSILFAVEEN